MRPADTVQRRPRPKFSALLSLCLVCAAAAHAQSGRTPAPPPGDTRPRQVKPPPQEQHPRAFIVASAPPDGSQAESAYVPTYAHNDDLEEIARGACLVALRNLPGVNVVEDVNVPRRLARETALSEGEAWVVWLELTWTTNTTRGDLPPFKLRYLLFEPRTGRMVSSGYGRGARQTWGRPAPRVFDVSEQLRNAGRDVADQVLSALRKTP